MKILEVKDICKKFGNLKVLGGVSFSMDEGEVISIIGSSGSGKTTLLRCLNFLEWAGSVKVFLDGELLIDAETAKTLSAKSSSSG